ncbi:MAG: AraC family transcriptional activator of pobA [Paracoccaceae bacterium]|jgi:AraC-like DNA-binding protein
MRSDFAVVSLGKARMRGGWRVTTLGARPFHQLLWITRGQGRITVGGITRGYSANRAIFVPAGTLMSIELGAQVNGLILDIPPDPQLGLPTDTFNLRVADMTAQAQLTSYIEQIERELSGKSIGFDRMLRGYMLLLSTWIERQLNGQDVAVLRDRSHQLVERYARLIQEDFRSGLSVADFAARLGVTPTHLSRVCKDASGRPAHALLQDRIMHEARRLLADTDMPAREVAEHLGFSSAAYFTRAFSQQTRLTPSQFRSNPER